jgi:hypothetical protein
MTPVVTVVPYKAKASIKLGIAVISLVFSPTFSYPKTKLLSLAQALTM